MQTDPEVLRQTRITVRALCWRCCVRENMSVDSTRLALEVALESPFHALACYEAIRASLAEQVVESGSNAAGALLVLPPEHTRSRTALSPP